MDDYQIILNNIRRNKRLMGWSNKKIAGMVGYSESTVERIFRGENVKLYAFLDTCKAMGIEVRVV